MKRKYFIALSFVAALFLVSFTSNISKKDKSYKAVVVLELFTSQGCSSCPKADELLAKVAEEYTNDNVFALSYHVDYWDYIGWKDPFAKKEFTDKQRVYARKLSQRSMYTPEVVVNGKEHFVGSNRSKMYRKVKTYMKETVANEVAVSEVKKTDGKVKFNYTIKGDLAAKKVRAVLAIQERTTKVKRGENSNRTLTNKNIVVSEKYLADAKTTGNYTIEIPKIVESTDNLVVFLIVENEQLDIISATKSSL